jgi:hypothetical protein
VPGQPYGQPVPGQPVPGQPYGAPPKKGRGGKIALIIGGVVVLLLCLCGVGGVVLFNRLSDEIPDQLDALPSIDVTEPPPTPEGTGGDEEFTKGDCVVNEGTASDPQLKKVTCAANTFEVTAVIQFTTDKNQCDNDILGAGKGNWDSTYTFNESPGALGDYVLCLKER